MAVAVVFNSNSPVKTCRSFRTIGHNSRPPSSIGNSLVRSPGPDVFVCDGPAHACICRLPLHNDSEHTECAEREPRQTACLAQRKSPNLECEQTGGRTLRCFRLASLKVLRRERERIIERFYRFGSDKLVTCSLICGWLLPNSYTKSCVATCFSHISSQNEMIFLTMFWF